MDEKDEITTVENSNERVEESSEIEICQEIDLLLNKDSAEKATETETAKDVNSNCDLDLLQTNAECDMDTSEKNVQLERESLRDCVYETQVEKSSVTIGDKTLCNSLEALTQSDEEEILQEELGCEVIQSNAREKGSGFVNVDLVPNGLNEMTIWKLHPIHQKLQEEMVTLQWKCKQQAEQISQLKYENKRLHDELNDKTSTAPDIYEVQMEALEKTITNLQKEKKFFEEKLITHDEIAKKTIALIKQELNGKLEKMTAAYEAANKEKELMVIKYAQGQKEILILKKLQEDVEKKFRDGVKEREILFTKLQNLNIERTRVCQALDIKTSEVADLVREAEKTKEMLNSKDIKIKWAQNKLRTEMDAHKETESKLDKLQQKLQQTREEADQIRKDCQEMIRTYQESEDVRSNSLDIQLKVKETELEMQMKEKYNQEEVYHSLRQELEMFKKKNRLSQEENNNLVGKIQSLESERLEYEINLGKLKDSLNGSKQEIVDLQARLAEMDNLKTILEREKEKYIAIQTEIERIRLANADLQTDMDACRAKEGELLEFTERLTSKNVTLQSEHAVLESKYQANILEQTRLARLNEDLENQVKSLKSQLAEEKQLRQQDTQMLAKKLAEKTRTAETLTTKLEEETNENRVTKRRHAASVKELTREIQMLKRRVESYESANYVRSNLSAPGLGSRASSNASLDTIANAGSCTGLNNPTLGNTSGHWNASTTNGPVTEDNVITIEPSRQLLIERIVKLQKSLARKNEKIDFLDEHVKQLLNEIKKKSKIIQGYVMKLETGALATEKMDQNKVDLARRGGIMASVYNSQASDNGMTFELSLEINHKLQAVLEDTLLKNITLKENINTLGDEISRLTKEQQKLQQCLS